MRAGVLITVLCIGCGEGSGDRGTGGEAETEAEAETETEAETDADADAEAEAETADPPLPLDDTPGLSVTLVAVELGPEAAAPRAVIAEVAIDDLSFAVGEAPTYYRIPAPGDLDPATPLIEAPLTLAPGERRTLSRLLAWAPGTTSLALTIAARSADTTSTSETVHIGVGSPSRITLEGGDVSFTLAARTGATPLSADTRVGLTLDGALTPADLAARVAGPIMVKHYAGARRWLLRPGCDSDAQCAEGGESHPCVSRCACSCDEAACDCDFSELESVMEREALATARRLVGDDEGQLPRVRVHWVFKRSLGGTASCDAHGELDVAPATWRRFFARATAAAIAINERLGFRLIDVLSPMNEANHPLQDGAHRNAAGQPTVGGLVAFSEVIHRATCTAGRCCANDRYIVDDPDVPALSAAAMAGAWQVLATAGPTLAPEVALSLYLDVEQIDPLQVDGDGARPSIVTPVGAFMAAMLPSLDGEPFPDALLVVDSYPGSWGAPWFEAEDGIVHHVDAATGRVVRVDPVAAADAAIARALGAADDFAAVVGRRPRVLLGEVGWSTFDGDEAAQARFVRRLFDAAAAAQLRDPALNGFVWFKTRDRLPFSYPTWDSAPSPLDGSEVACDAHLVGPVACTAAVLALMEGQWGLARADGTRKEAWEALMGRWARATAVSDR